MSLKYTALVALSAGLALSGVGYGAETKEEAREKREHRDLPRKELLYGSNIIGETVETSQGEKVGSIKELMIDPKDGKIVFGVVTVNGGFLGMGSKHVAIPWDQFRLSPSRHGYLLDVNRQALVDEPAFEEGRYERTSSPAPVVREDKVAFDAKDLKHYSGKVAAVDLGTGTIQIKKMLTTHAFNVGTGREAELNRFRVGDEVEVDYREDNGVNIVHEIRPATK